MRLIVRTDIEIWCQSHEAKGQFPVVISRLIHAITPVSTLVDFPAGPSVYVGGYDGKVTCETNCAYVPQGLSVWELGTEGSPRGKADEDYDKRKKNPEVDDPKEITFVFVTPRYWKGKNDWCKKKRAEGVWKDVLAFDSESLEQWFDIAFPVARWFARYVNKVPPDNIILPEEYWAEWATGPYELVPEVVTAGREKEKELLLKFFREKASIKGVRGSTKDEAIAFIIACAQQFEPHDKGLFFTKTLIVEGSGQFRMVRQNNRKSPLNLIAMFDDVQAVNAATGDSHHVIVPLGADDPFNGEDIWLPTIDRDGQIAALVKSKVPPEDSDKYSREAGRDITILKKLLKFEINRAEWLKRESLREILPALLLGRWDERRVGDRELLEYLSGQPYENYMQVLARWKAFSGSPILQIGDTWRLVSPFAAWTYLSAVPLRTDFEHLEVCFSRAFKSGNPPVPSKHNLSHLLSPELTYSSWVREGIVQSMILIASHGENLRLSTPIAPQMWVDGVVKSMLYKATGDLWVSVNRELPLIAEASPSSFIECVRASLFSEEAQIMKMFDEKAGLLYPAAQHTGLLWALEGIAWLPEYFANASLILARLAALDPGGSVTNRPINSLSEIFNPWHYQTLADFKTRAGVIDLIVAREKDVAWNLLRSLLPDHHAVARPTHRMRWRMFENTIQLVYTYDEMSKMNSHAVKGLIAAFDFSDEKAAQLIEDSPRLNKEDRNAILSMIGSSIDRITTHENLAWHALRKMLSLHRSFVDVEWSMTDDELKPYQELYDRMKPSGHLKDLLWIFNESWIDLPEGGQEMDNYDSVLLQKRIEIMQNMLSRFGLEQVIAARKEVKEPFVLADTLARVIPNDTHSVPLANLFIEDKEDLSFVNTFFSTKSYLNDFSWITSTFEVLQQSGFDDSTLGRFLVPLKQTNDMWMFLETQSDDIQREYWTSVTLRLFDQTANEKNYAFSKLIAYKRFSDAAKRAAHHVAEINSNLMVDILTGLVGEPQVKISQHEIDRIFLELDKRQDVDRQQLVVLEWQYLPVLTHHGARRTPKLLHTEMAESPSFFIEVLKWAFRPKNDIKLLEAEQAGMDDEVVRARSDQAYRLFSSWRSIPGLSADGEIDKDTLLNWTDEVRTLAEKVDRLGIADSMIGKVLATYAERDIGWPPDEICELIETLNSEAMIASFGTQITNNHSSSTRGMFEGGTVERKLAAYFRKHSLAHQAKHPIIAGILDRVAKGFEWRALQEDQDAERNKLEY